MIGAGSRRYSPCRYKLIEAKRDRSGSNIRIATQGSCEYDVWRFQLEVCSRSNSEFPQLKNPILGPRIDPQRPSPWLMTSCCFSTRNKVLRIGGPCCLDYAVSVRTTV